MKSEQNLSIKTSTLGRTIKLALPHGTNPRMIIDASQPPANANGCPQPWQIAPIFPPDIFAVAGYLCKMAGVVGYFDPDPNNGTPGRHHFCLTPEDRRVADKAAEEWRKTPQTSLPQTIVELWNDLIRCWPEPVTPGHHIAAKQTPAPWWKSALTLVMIADLACNRMLKNKHPEFEHSPFEE